MRHITKPDVYLFAQIGVLTRKLDDGVTVKWKQSVCKISECEGISSLSVSSLSVS